MEYVFFVALLLIMIALALLFILAPVMRNRKNANGIVNYDPFMQNYLFKLAITKDRFLERLKTKNASDKLEYAFDSNAMILTFSQYGADIPYTVTIQEYDGGCIVRLKKNAFIGSRSNIPFHINEFMMQKFHVELLPYEENKNTAP